MYPQREAGPVFLDTFSPDQCPVTERRFSPVAARSPPPTPYPRIAVTHPPHESARTHS